MKPCGAWCAAWARGEDIRSPREFEPRFAAFRKSFLGLLLLPLVEIRLAHHLQRRAHLKMAEAAELRARDLKDAELVRLKVQRDLHAGDDILLHPQFAHKEVVDHVARVHDEP